MAIKFVTDSASDILPAEAAEMGVTVVPLTVTFDGVEYADTIDINHEEFFEKLVKSEKLPTTSQVTPDAFGEAFSRLTENGDTVIAVVLSSRLSGTYQSACIAAEDCSGKVLVVDSLSATIGERMLLLSAIEFAKQGMEAEEIVSRLNSLRERVRIYAVLDTLEYLKKGGRISATVAFAGSLLAIKPIITVNDGSVELIGKARGAKNGAAMLAKFINSSGGVDTSRPYCVLYSGLSDERLKRFVADTPELWQKPYEELPVCTIGCVIGTHVGPGAYGVAFYETK